jgi:outer membrane protein OmpA-like peptidoglycan-associated protein
MGLYIDYGVTDLKEKNGTMPLVTYSPTGINGAQANGVLNMPNAGQVKPLSFGLQVRLSFGSTSPRSAAQHKIKRSPQLQLQMDSTISGDDSDLIERPVVFGLLGETIVPEVQRTHLDRVADLMTRHPQIRISIVGHTCNSGGTETEDPRLGDTRARAVARYLEDKGIDPRRMEVSFVHESDPAQLADAAANYANRRAEITMK